MSVSPDRFKDIRAYSPVVFVNRAAGGRRTQFHLPRIRKLFESLHLSVNFVFVQSATELESAVKAMMARNHYLLLAMGGDGTFQALANATFGERVLLGVLPTGGGNDFASALGLPRDPFKAAEAVLQGVERAVDLVKVHTADGRLRLYVGGGGAGLDAEAAHYASGSYRRLPGRLRYVVSALRALSIHRPLEIRIDFPESPLQSVEAKALLAAVLNSPTYGAGVRLGPGAEIDDGLLDVVMVEDLKANEVLTLLPRFIARGELESSRVKRWRAKRVRLTPSRPCLFHGDGEIIGLAPVEIEALHRAIRVLAPLNK